MFRVTLPLNKSTRVSAVSHMEINTFRNTYLSSQLEGKGETSHILNIRNTC